MNDMSTSSRPPLRILFVGAMNIGSHSGGMARALVRAGHLLQVVDPRQFIPTVKSSRLLRIIRRPLVRMFEREFNEQILRDLKSFEPQALVVYKGESVMPYALAAARAAGVYSVNVYPDVSVFTHGPWLPRTLPLYDHIFTTKSFGPRDLQEHLGITQVSVLPHGYDPEVHCPMPPGAVLPPALQADVSFIGTWSPKKERLIDAVIRTCPGITLKIWGSQWNRAQSEAVRACAMFKDIMGNIYSVALQASTINLALLSEKWPGASSGDQVTSRTFDIPACNAFMIHERTEELLKHLQEDVEVACFGDGAELAAKVKYYLAHPEERARILRAGHLRCLAEHSIDHRARVVLEHCYQHLPQPSA